MKKELFRKLGERQDFEVPDGYFDQLTSEVMGKISDYQTIHPSATKGKSSHWIKQTISAAAILTGIIFATATIHHQKGELIQLATTEESTIDLTSDEFIDETMLAYSIDDYSFYLYLTADDI